MSKYIIPLMSNLLLSHKRNVSNDANSINVAAYYWCISCYCEAFREEDSEQGHRNGRS